MGGITLDDLGWDEEFARALVALGRGLVPARVVMTRGPISRLHTGAAEHDAIVPGKVRRAAAGAVELPVVGDWVAARLPGRAGELTSIEAVLPRRSVFARRAAGDTTAAQALAANIDTVFVVMGLDADHNLRRLERYLALAFASGASPVVVLSKADLCADLPARLAETAPVAAGVPVIPAALLEGVPPALRALVAPGRTVALLGSSGAGKSTLLNRLLLSDVQKTGEVRPSDLRGKHTTSHRQLFFVPGGGMVIDSPGLREIQLWDAGEGLGTAFEDVEALAAECRFRDCAHGDEPGCAVVAAVGAGRLPADRLASWRKLSGELAATAQKEDVLSRRRSKQGGRMMSRLLRARLREKQK
jgi:ribosome biogenesis GTPase / thiamine phosphate phosphatase